MRKILAIAFFLFIVSVASAFAQTEDTRVFEASNDFTEIKTAFQKRVHDAFPDYKYFFHDESPFDVDGEQSELFDNKAHKTISKNKYFIFEVCNARVYFLYLVNKEDTTAIAFFFINDTLVTATPCTQAEIDKALGLYLGL